MTADEGVDVGREGLQRLLTLLPDASRAERTRARCHAQLRRRRQRAASRTALAAYAWRVVGPALVGGVCILYAAALLTTTLRLEFP
jgi:hypothetical protein